MRPLVKKSIIGCGGIFALMGMAMVALIAFSGPGKAPAHRFDSFHRDPDACINAFDGRDAKAFTHIWVLRSPDLKSWWAPNGLRADADLILDSEDPEIIQAVLAHTKASAGVSNHVRTLSQGRIFHVLLFNEPRRTYAHLRFSYRSKQADGSTVFMLVTNDNGASPVKDCPGFLEFEKLFLNPTAIKREDKAVD